jgi:hypothetical protein
MLKRYVCLTAVLFVAAACASAQESRGQILGRVTDPSGAVIVGATVRATNAATNVVTTANTSETGDYTLPFLVAGDYEVSAESTGFKKIQRKGILVRIQDSVTLNLTLPIGTSSESIEVTAELPVLESSTASMGQVLDQRRIQELPVNYNNALMLAQLGPGVTNLSTNNQTQTFTSSTPSNVAINGVGNNDHAFTIDGASNNAGGRSGTGGNIGYTPPAAALSEFKIETAIFDASRGFGSGSSINMSLKSGANALHGEMYDTFQNPVLNANSFFSNKNNLPKDNNRQQQWGFDVNGPVEIPHVYNGRDKTFWMFGYEGISNSYPKSTGALYTIPTDPQKNGDFSGIPAPIFDPKTTVAIAGGHFQRTQFPGNIIPKSRLDPIALNIISTYLTVRPNTAPKSDGTNNYIQAQNQDNSFLSTVFRVDENLSERQRFFVRGNFSNLDEPDQLRFNDSAGWIFQRQSRALGLDHVYTFSPSVILNTRLTFNRYYQGSYTISTGKADLKALGFSQTFIDRVGSVYKGVPALPYIDVSGGFPALASDAINASGGDTYTGTGALMWNHRNHAFQFGGEYRLYRDTSLNLGNAFGRLTYGTTYTTASDTTPAATSGQGLAAFLLGQPTGGQMSIAASYAQQIQAAGWYAQDSWKVSPKLTINLGLRAEIERPVTERFNRSVAQFDAASVNPLASTAVANYAKSSIAQVPAPSFSVLGGLTFAGVNGKPRNLYSENWMPLMPRLGIAYQLNELTVIRAGYSIFDDLSRESPNQTGFSQNTALNPSPDNGLTFTASTYNPFPNPLLQPMGASQGLLTSAGNSISAFPAELKRQYFQRWQLSVQRQIAKQTSVEIAYVGNRGNRLFIDRQYDAIPAQYLSTLPTRDTTLINALSAKVNNPFYPLLPGTSGLASTTTTVGQLLRPYPEFTGITITGNQGYSWYHGLQTQIQRRFARGFTLSGGWTWSKWMDAESYRSDTDPMPERVISSMDRPHRFTASGIWELPFGRGKRFGSSLAGLPGKLAGGWQVQGIYQWQSGSPLGFGNALIYTAPQSVVVPSDQRTIDHWFNTAPFEKSTANQLGNNINTLSSRFSAVRGPGINMVDMSVIKSTNINERVRAQLKGEFINALNHTQFSNPNTSPTSASFGTITGTGQLPRTIQLGLKILF